MTAPRIGSLCSGYGGLDLGVESVVGGSVGWFCEYDRDPSAILAHHWPDTPNHGDVKTTDWATVEPVDILTAGYPCQPFSHAGKRKGADDPRHLWPDVARAIGALRPGLVVLENVAGHVSLGLADVLGDLSALGYDATWGVVRAADAGAPHGRARIFIVAHTKGDPWRISYGDCGAAPDAIGERLDGRRTDGAAGGTRRRRGDAPRPAGAPADAHGAGLEGHGELHPAPGEGEAAAHDRGAANPEGGRWGTRPGRRTPEARRSEPGTGDDPRVSWGQYADAIARWEWVTGRPAPAPTEPGNGGRRRLSGPFVEWMMGLPAGHVTDAPISRTAKLKALGNGVVPQQAALALSLLLPRALDGAA